MPQDSIMQWAQNDEGMYNDMIALWDRWVDQGDGWDEPRAYKEARALVGHMAEHIESFDFTEGRYSPDEMDDAASDMMQRFREYREEAVERRMKEASRKPTPEDMAMDAGDVEHAKKYEEMAQRLGVEKLRALIPVTQERVRKALERGDKHLNSIPLRKWDAAAFQLNLRERGLSIAEGVCVLKHVAKWHYA
jgi:DNA-directed RNA polymerase alpha subunit